MANSVNNQMMSQNFAKATQQGQGGFIPPSGK